MDAVLRMDGVVDKDNLAALEIACSITNDPIRCMSNGDGTITITYFAGDNAHRQPYLSKKVWVEKKVEVISGPLFSPK